MQLNLPDHITQVLHQLRQQGYQASIVGGAVRDILLHKIPKDYDIVSSAEISQVLQSFAKVLPIGEKHGTVVVFLDGEEVEITRCKCPEDPGCSWEDCLHKDLSQRDFTINAMAIDDKGRLLDPFGGKKDLERRVIRSPGNEAAQRFEEDPLRMLRAVRLAVVMDFRLDESLLAAIKAGCALLAQASPERIRDELAAILISDRPAEGLTMMVETGLMEYVIPEIMPMVGFEQHNPAHISDVFTHTLAVVERVPAHLDIRMAALLHDIGKPATFTLDEKGIGHFYQHQEESQRLAAEILARLRFSRSLSDKVCTLAGNHMVWLKKPEPIAVKRLINRVGRDNLEDLFSLQRADISGSAPFHDISFIDEAQSMSQEIIKSNAPLTVQDLAVNGRDLIQIGYEPGPGIGQTLQQLLEIVLQNPDQNQKQYLLDIAAKWLRQ